MAGLLEDVTPLAQLKVSNSCWFLGAGATAAAVRHLWTSEADGAEDDHGGCCAARHSCRRDCCPHQVTLQPSHFAQHIQAVEEPLESDVVLNGSLLGSWFSWTFLDLTFCCPKRAISSRYRCVLAIVSSRKPSLGQCLVDKHILGRLCSLMENMPQQAGQRSCQKHPLQFFGRKSGAPGPRRELLRPSLLLMLCFALF